MDTKPRPVNVSTAENNFSLVEASKTQYAIHLMNNTNDNFYFAVYQSLPDSSGLTSVAWQVYPLPKQSNQTIDWQLDYGVVITEWDPKEKQFSAPKQEVNATPGEKYHVFSDGEFVIIDPTPVHITTNGKIAFSNKTTIPHATDLDLGFTLFGNLVAARSKVHAGESVFFSVSPVYYVACYWDIELGQLVNSNIALGPAEVKFQEGVTNMNVEAYIHDGEYLMKVTNS